ncbi:unnamed protein product [Auanema sp. JU1783]|nr:unnamed protein product [Auanema sp. JU1783]
MSASTSLSLQDLHDGLCPYLQEIISAKLKPHILHLSQYSQNPFIKQNWLSRYPILTYENIFYKKSKIFVQAPGSDEIFEKRCVIYAENFTFHECFTKSTLDEMRELRKRVRIKGPVVVLKKSFECSVDNLQELFEIVEAQGLTLYGPHKMGDILSLPAVSKVS